MKPISEVYPEHAKDEADGNGFYGPSDYTPLLESIGHEIVHREDQDDYQGDSWLIFRDGQRWGYLEFGWGSCSGCDALQGCDTMAEIAELRMNLVNKTKWFKTAADALAWFKSHNWETDYSWCQEELRRFVKDATDILMKEAESA